MTSTKIGVLAQIAKNKLQYALAQITINIFFYVRTRTKIRCVLAPPQQQQQQSL